MPETTFGAVEFAEVAVRRGLESASRWLHGELREVPAYRNIEDWLRTMARVEVKMDEARLRLEGLAAAGLARQVDYARYEQLRDNLYAMHVRADRLVRSAFGNVPEIVQHLPQLKKAPKVQPPVPVELDGLGAQIYRVRQREGAFGWGSPADIGRPDLTPQQIGLHGHDYGRRPIPNGGGFGDRFTALGNPGAAVPAAAAGLAAWQWAAIVLVVLAAVVVVAIIIGGVLLSDTIRDTTVNLAALEKQAEALALRQSCYERCLEEGGASSACVAQCIQLYPMPELPDLPGPHGWVKWVAAAVITVAVIGGAVYFVRRRRRARARRLRGTSRSPRHRQLSPEEFLESDSNYGLEV